MAIYVQSRGKNQDQDYRWLRIKSADSYPENPNFLIQTIGNLAVKPVDLIESQKFSVILVAHQDKYYLLITGLKAREERADFTGRSVRNSILWICPKDSENIKIRSLLILALQGKLEREIDKIITAAGEYGFEVNYKSLVQLSNSTLNIGNNQNTDLNCKIGKNSELLRQQIALELETNPLPDRNGLLVLVTSIKSASALKKTGVWRGLSNRIKHEEFEEYSSLARGSQQAQKKTIFLGITIAIISIIAIALLIIKLTTPQKLQPEPPPSSPKLEKLTSLDKKSGKLWKKELKSIELLSIYPNQEKTVYFLSPYSLNVKNN